ncbi:MAG TPA: MFS transporter [Candidatus Eremiobacteraceae bacterium]|nr:MFS transporter [Candidatus Eremiobacteraceae bacterium]
MVTAVLADSTKATSPLHNRYFRLLWAGRAISGLGDQCYLVALPWLVLQLTTSGVALGTVMMTGAIPTAVLMLVGGVLSDRLSARRILLVTTSVRAVCVAAIGALVALHVVALWQIYLLALAFGIADAFAAPASQTLVPSILEREQLPAASSITQSTQQLAMIIGPAPAGLLVKLLGTAWAFFIDAFSFLFVIAALWRIPDPPMSQAGKARSGILNSIAEGLRYINADVAMRSLLFVAAALNFCVAGPVSIGLAWIAKQHFGSPIAFSVFVASVAAGGLAGAVAAGIHTPHRRGVLMLAVSFMVALGTALLGVVTQVWSLSAVLFAMGAASGYLNVHLVAWFQQRVDRDMLGRTMSVIMLAAVGLQPLSLAFAGIAVAWSVAGMFAGSAALMLAVTILAALHKPVRDIE